jgi:hypothetical protein
LLKRTTLPTFPILSGRDTWLRYIPLYFVQKTTQPTFMILSGRDTWLRYIPIWATKYINCIIIPGSDALI